MELAFVLFTGPTEAVCQPLYSHVLFMKTPRRKFLLSVRAWERLLLLAMGLDTKPLVNLISFVAWAARKLGERGGGTCGSKRTVKRYQGHSWECLNFSPVSPSPHIPDNDPDLVTMHKHRCSSETSSTAGLTDLKTFAALCKAVAPGRVLSKLSGHLSEEQSLGIPGFEVGH